MGRIGRNPATTMEEIKYIVALETSGRYGDAAYIKNFVYKSHMNYVANYGTVLDSKGSITNAWSKSKFRDATEEEAKLYELWKKPVRINDDSLEGVLYLIKREINE